MKRPDNNVYITCIYVIENEFKAFTTEKQRSFSTIQLNTRSLKANYDCIRLFEFDFDITTVSGSWLEINKHDLFPIYDCQTF